MDKSLQDKIRAEIKKTGFPLELELTEKLRQQDRVLVFPNISFQNEEKSIKELDIVAFFQDKDDEWDFGPVSIEVLIECKKTDKYPWVFFEEVYDPLTSLGLVQRADYLIDLKMQIPCTVLMGCKNTELNQHHYDDFNLPKFKTYFEAFKTSNDSTIFKAVMNIFHGRKYLKELFNRQFSGKKSENYNYRTFLMQYVIVLDGQLILASKSNGDFDLSEVNHIILKTIDTISTTNNSLLGDEILIDIVTREYFDEYVELTKKDVKKFSSHLKTIKNFELFKTN